jgi:hypothetical protein
MCNTHILYLLLLFSNAICIFGAFYLLAPAVLCFSTSVLVLSFLCDGRLNICRLLVSIFILCCGGLRVGMVGWEGDSRKDVDGSMYYHFV